MFCKFSGSSAHSKPGDSSRKSTWESPHWGEEPSGRAAEHTDCPATARPIRTPGWWEGKQHNTTVIMLKRYFCSLPWELIYFLPYCQKILTCELQYNSRILKTNAQQISSIQMQCLQGVFFFYYTFYVKWASAVLNTNRNEIIKLEPQTYTCRREGDKNDV